MCGGVSIPTEIALAIYPYLPMHVTKCMSMHRKCFGHLPFPTEACQEVYLYPPKLFPKFTVTFRGGQAKVSVCTENVSVIYHSLLMQAGRCIHTHRNYFDNLWWPSAAGWQRFVHALKMLQWFTIPSWGMPGGVSIPTEIVLSIYHDLLRHAGRCIGMHQNCFSNLLCLEHASVFLSLP